MVKREVIMKYISRLDKLVKVSDVISEVIEYFATTECDPCYQTAEDEGLSYEDFVREYCSKCIIYKIKQKLLDMKRGVEGLIEEVYKELIEVGKDEE